VQLEGLVFGAGAQLGYTALFWEVLTLSGGIGAGYGFSTTPARDVTLQVGEQVVTIPQGLPWTGLGVGQLQPLAHLEAVRVGVKPWWGWSGGAPAATSGRHGRSAGRLEAGHGAKRLYRSGG
jgi:hypothetical protein